MRLDEILTEPVPGVTNSPQDDYVLNLRQFIQADCQLWLAASRGLLVYRGIHSAPENTPAFTREVRNDRKPLDSGLHQNRMFDFWLASAGSVSQRHNSAFVTGDMGNTSDYGKPFVVMPVGQFHYAWSPVMRDWHVDCASRTGHVYGLTADAHRLVEIARSDQDLWWEFLAKLTQWTGWDLTQVKSGPAAAVKHLIDQGDWFRVASWFDEDTIMNPQNHDPRKARDVVQVNEGLIDAIESRHEIMIRAQSMLYVRPTLYRDAELPGWGHLVGKIIPPEKL